LIQFTDSVDGGVGSVYGRSRISKVAARRPA
jgi:hypothetical protein